LLSLYTVYASPKTATQVVIIEQITSTTTVVPYLPISPQMKILYNKIKYLYTEIIRMDVIYVTSNKKYKRLKETG